MIKKLTLTTAALAGIATLTSCDQSSKDSSAENAAAKPTVATVNYPLAFITEQIAGESVTIHFPSMDGDPAFWQPTADDVAAYQAADLILLNGATFAKWTDKVSLPPAKLVNTSAGLGDKIIVEDGGPAHSHGDGEVHSHGETAFTTWIDPQLAIAQAAAVNTALCKQWPQGAQVFTKNYAELTKELSDLDNALTVAMGAVGKTHLIASHPVYQYLERRYDLNLTSLHWEPDTAPDAMMWLELDEIVSEHPDSIMVWEDEPLAETRKELEKRNIRIVVFNPCGNRPDNGNYLEVMTKNIENLKAVVGE